LLKFAANFIRRPSKALDLVQNDPRAALRAAAGVYAVYLATAVLFYTLKPDGFPPPTPGALAAPVDPVERGLLFWIKVQAWSPLLLAVWVAAAAWFSRLLGSGKLAIRLPAAVGAAAVPLLLIVVYYGGSIPKWGFGAAWLVLAGVMAPGFTVFSKEDWIRIFAALAGVHAIGVLLLVPFTIAVALRSAYFYHAVEFLMLFWVLGLGTYSLRRILSIATARAFAAIFLSLVAQILFVFSMYMLGLMPKEVLKALMAA
jgi:hypothetical protein